MCCVPGVWLSVRLTALDPSNNKAGLVFILRSLWLLKPAQDRYLLCCDQAPLLVITAEGFAFSQEIFVGSTHIDCSDFWFFSLFYLHEPSCCQVQLDGQLIHLHLKNGIGVGLPPWNKISFIR